MLIVVKNWSVSMQYVLVDSVKSSDAYCFNSHQAFATDLKYGNLKYAAYILPFKMSSNLGAKAVGFQQSLKH